MMSEMAVIQSLMKKYGYRENGHLNGNGIDGGTDDDLLPPPKINSDADSIAELLKDDTPEVSPTTSPVISHSELAKDGEESPESRTTEEPTPPLEEEKPASEYDDRQTALLNKCLKLWQRYPDSTLKLISPENTDPPEDGVATENNPNGNGNEHHYSAPTFVATVIRVPKNPSVLKGGYLLVPNADSTRWVKRFVELRRPYLHIHSVADGEEIGIVSLRNARVDSQPGILGLLHSHQDYDHNNFDPDNVAQQQSGGIVGGVASTATGLISSLTGTPGQGQGISRLSERLQAGVFAIYGTDNTWLFAARSERDKLEWIFRIDQSFAQTGSTPAGSVMGAGSNSGTASPMPRW